MMTSYEMAMRVAQAVREACGKHLYSADTVLGQERGIEPFDLEPIVREVLGEQGPDERDILLNNATRLANEEGEKRAAALVSLSSLRDAVIEMDLAEVEADSARSASEQGYTDDYPVGMPQEVRSAKWNAALDREALAVKRFRSVLADTALPATYGARLLTEAGGQAALHEQRLGHAEFTSMRLRAEAAEAVALRHNRALTKLREATVHLESLVTVPRGQVTRLSSTQIDAVFRFMAVLSGEAL